MTSTGFPANKPIFDRSRLIGRWDIRSWHEIHKDGRSVAPFGERPTGFLRYEASGDMMCLITKPDRPPFCSARQFEASAAEKARAYDDFFVYAGSYEVSPEGLTHHVAFALFPNWERSTQIRRIAHLSAERLCLEADVRGVDLAPYLVRIEWEKART